MDLKNYFIESDTKKAEFARAINVSPALLHQWIENIRPVAIQHCPAIERETCGKVTRRELRPDDWYKIWPELVVVDPGHAGRQPPTTNAIFDTVPARAAVGIDISAKP